MDVERLIVRMVADTTLYTRALDGAQARLFYFTTAISESFVRSAAVAAASYEKSGIAFEVMTKSATVAKSLLEDLNQMAVETPFHSAELIDYTKQLSAFGIETDAIIPTLHVLGEVASATNSRMDRLVLAFGQVKSIGHLMGQELRQFTNAGVPMVEALAHVMQKPTDQIINLIHAGQVGFPDVVRALNYLTVSGGRFAGMMERVNKETTAGHWEAMTERIMLASRKIALAAFKGLGINSGLDQIGSVFGNVNESGAIEFFRDVRSILQVTVALLGRLRNGISEAFGDGVSWIRRWVSANRELVNILAATLVIMIALHRTSILLRSAWTFAPVIASLFAGLLSPLGLLTIGLGALLALLSQLGAFSGAADRLIDSFGKIESTFTKAWGGIVDAVRGGDLELAMNIAGLGISAIWGLTLATMEVEWEQFKGKIGQKVGGGALDLVKRLGANVGGVFWGKDARDVELRKIEENRRHMEEISRATTDDRIRRINEQALRDLERRHNELTEQAKIANIGRVTGEALESETGRSIGDWIMRGHKKFIGRDPGRDAGLRNPEDFGKLIIKMPEYAGGSVVPPGSGLSSIMGAAAVEGQYRKLWMNAANAINKYQMGVDAGAAPEVLKRLAKEANDAVGQLDKFTEAITGVKNSAKGMKDQLDISGPAKQAVAQLQKDLLSNVQPYDHFIKQSQLFMEALRGPLPGAGGIIPQFGLGTGPGAGQLTPDEFKTGIFMEYEKLSKSLGSRSANSLPPAAFRGSREAAEIINRNRDQGLSLEQEALRVMQEAKTIAEQHAEYSKQMKDILFRLVTEGGLKVKGP